MTQKILIAIDESENAMRAVEYVAKSFKTDCDITIFSVVPETPAICNINSPSLTPYFQQQQAVFCMLEDQKKSLVLDASQKAKEKLIGAGFDETRIATKVEEKQKGVARIIVDKAKSGYDLIVMGRRGISGLKEFFIGSVSQKVLQSASDISLLIVE